MPQWDPNTYKRFSSLLGQGPRLAYPEDEAAGITAPIKGLVSSRPSAPATPGSPSVNPFTEGPLTQSRVTPTPSSGPTMRNQARVEYLAKALGLPEESAGGSISQTDFEDVYGDVQAEDLQRKLALATEPIKAKAQYEMPLEMARLQTPLEQARITGEYGLKERELANRSALEVEQARREGARDVANISQSGALQRMLGMQEMAQSIAQGGGNINRMTMPTVSGGGSFGLAPTKGISPLLLNSLKVAAGKKAQIDDDVTNAEYNQALSNVLGAETEFPELKEGILQTMKEIAASGKNPTTEQILNDLKNEVNIGQEVELDARERDFARRIINYIRGNF